ncbi:hypothetical protein I2I05_18755 [Hymenobacter sp. BT683]|uniref:YgjV family protein n=1 Tax=Hymenobacter jeongseonensis TaxID=2791027 RepID=A0ABS0IM50_9BACT|nr:hypothetical protein [Hymenobacter jeongseonensis]MBF9239440.1 hypothetical protein [Hymenobacter jeongseonensis]
MNAHSNPWELLTGPLLCSLALWLSRGAGPADPRQRAFNGSYLLLVSYFFAWSLGKIPLVLNAAVIILPLLAIRLFHRRGQGVSPGLPVTRPKWPSASDGGKTAPPPRAPAKATLRRAHGLLAPQPGGRRAQQWQCTPRESALQYAAHCLQLFPN